MATAASKVRADTNGAETASEPELMQFLIAEDNGGDYQWTLLDREGNSLARSPGYATYQDAEDAARVVLVGAGSARLDRAQRSTVRS